MNYSPDKIRELIPLYLNGRLSEKERQEFEDTLNKYPELKHEVEEFSEIKDVYKEIEHEISIPSSVLYQRILRNIKSDIKVSSAFLKKGYIEKLQELLRGLLSSPRVSWGFAAVQFAILLLLFVNLLGGDKIRTLTSEDMPKSEGIKINVVFDKESREKEMREVLNKVGAIIIRGPSPEGLYTIEIKEKQDVEKVLEVLRKTEIVRFAERAY